MDDGYGPEVARLALPLPVRQMDALVDYLELAYGEHLVMHQEDRWLVFTQPTTRSPGRSSPTNGR